MTFPPDPNQPQPGSPLPPPPPQYGQPPYGPGNPHPPVQPHGYVVAKSGLTGGIHVVHAILTLFTCGLWSPIWLLHAVLARRKTTTRY